jgi:flavin-dependent dehydrogenase
VREVEAIIVGGGPAGSSCARRLREQGIEPLVLDRQAFPREKLCGGWITPEVLTDLELDPVDYPHSFLTFERLRIHLFRTAFSLGTRQHSIRRIEFDAWLLERSGAEVLTHDVKRVAADGDGFVVDGRFRCRYLVGAGGTKCPVYRTLFRGQCPRPRHLQVVALERELAYPWTDPDCHLWFFDKGLPGYAWYVPKENGVVNVGVGAFAEALKRRGADIKTHWKHFTRVLSRSGLVERQRLEPGGYSYYARSPDTPTRGGNAFVVGDAAGLATRDMCEGIGPAVRSGLLAADAIARTGEYGLEQVLRDTLERPWLSRLLGFKYFR